MILEPCNQCTLPLLPPVCRYVRSSLISTASPRLVLVLYPGSTDLQSLALSIAFCLPPRFPTLGAGMTTLLFSVSFSSHTSLVREGGGKHLQSVSSSNKTSTEVSSSSFPLPSSLPRRLESTRRVLAPPPTNSHPARPHALDVNKIGKTQTKKREKRDCVINHMAQLEKKKKIETRDPTGSAWCNKQKSNEVP